MNENEIKHWTKPITNSIEKLVPTNRTLIDFVNEKAMGEGVKRSLYKVKFIDKSEKSTYTCIAMTINELKRSLKERNVKEEDSELIISKAKEILENAREQVAKVYGEVRRYVVTSELRTDCINHHFKKIPSLTDEQNSAISKEIFSLALEMINKNKNHSIDDIEEAFDNINHIALSLFKIISETGGSNKNIHKSHHKNKSHSSKSHSPFSLIEDFFER